MFYKLRSYYIPTISKFIPDPYSYIKIDVPINNDVLPSENAVGASISGGVDSFYSMHKHLGLKEESFNVTHVCFFNAGASGSGGEDYARNRYIKY